MGPWRPLKGKAMTEPRSEQSIFLHAIGLATPADRAAYLDEVCRDKPDLRAELEALLVAHDRLGADSSMTTGLEPEVNAPAAPARVEEMAEDVGAVLSGRYKLVEEIGEGGMGTVWMAQQTEPIKRPVAVKLIKPGMDSKQVLARFEAERQALALMDHANISKVLDAGSTPSGRPYFVMELVKGVPITKYCDERRLTPQQRLELFVPVCQAVQHAHQKGIIHRDIKPSNILVAQYDGRPVPKVIDFGVAKATGQQLTEKTLMTGFGSVVGTLEYMSPEQAELNQLDIDTRSDIYSLGVVLYELLTGSTPLDKKRFKQASFAELLRVIREEEPQKPSTRLSNSTDSLPSVSAQRQMEPAKLTRLVRGELDWIVMKALEKDRNRRYETANGFAMDIQRYLADEPVQACPPSAGYRFRKFVRRNKGPLLAISAIGLLLVAGIVGTTTGLVWALAAEKRTRTERDNKEKARQEALAAAEAEKLSRRQTRQAMDATTDHALEDLLGRQVRITGQHRKFFQKLLEFQEAFAAAKSNDPEGLQSRASAYFRVGRFCWLLGEFQESEAAHRHAVALQKDLVKDFPDQPDYRLDLAASQDNLGILLFETGRLKEAREMHRDALALREKLVGDFHGRPDFRRDLARSHLNLGRLLNATGQVKEAETAYRASVNLLQPMVDEFPAHSDYRENLATSYNNLANVLFALGREQEGKAAEGKALALQNDLVKDFPDYPEFRRMAALGHHNLASRLYDSGRLEEAEAAYRKALDLLQQLTDEFPARPEFREDLARSHILRGRLLHATGRLKDAEADWRDGQALLKQLATDLPTRPDFRHGLGASYNHLGMSLVATGRLEEAEAAFDKAQSLMKKLMDEIPARPDFREGLADSYDNLANLLRSTGRMKEAEAVRRDALALKRQLVAEFPDLAGVRGGLARTLHNLGVDLKEQKRYPEAEKIYHEALAIREQQAEAHRDQPAFQHDLAFTYNNLGSLLSETRRTAEAETAYRKALAIRKQLADDVRSRPELRQELARLHNNLGILLVEQKKDYEEAAKFYAVALALHKQLAVDLPTVADYQNDLASTLTNIAILHNHREEYTDAKALAEQARPHHQAALKANPRDLSYRKGYHGNLRVLAWSQVGLGDHVHLAMTADELAGFEYDPPNNVCHAARYLCICVKLVNKDTTLNSAKREELAKGFVDKAMALLGQAVTRGSKDAERLPTPIGYFQPIASCYVDVGDLLRAQRPPKESEAAYRKALEILQQLADKFPDKPECRENLAQGYHKLAGFQYDTRQLKEAETAYRAAIDLRKQLAKELAKRPDLRQELARCHNSLGNVLYLTNRNKEADAEYGNALPVFQQLVAEFPNDPDYRNGLAGTLVNLGMVRNQRREYAAAVPFLEQARPHHQAALKVNPKDRTAGLFYHNNLCTLAESHRQLGEHAQLATTADELARFGYDPVNDPYNAACDLCRCAVLADKDTKLDDGQRKELAKGYADRALVMLQQAVARGYNDVAHMKKDSNLEPLQGREEFQKLLAQLEKKNK
jgi:serine/threonine protein kinase/tetratricopeptide (TPR) repeat protein